MLYPTRSSALLVCVLPLLHAPRVCARANRTANACLTADACLCDSRGYTPELSEAYASSDKAGTETAIVFVSSDRDQTSFDEYYGSMTFDALPFSARDLKTALGEKYGVKGIPTLVLLDGAGELVDANIRGKHADYL